MSNLIERTLERLRRDGWVQGQFTDGDGACCVYGGLLTEAANDAAGGGLQPGDLFAADSDGALDQFDPKMLALARAVSAPTPYLLPGVAEAEQAIDDVLARRYGHPGESARAEIPAFNDAPDTDFDLVEDVLLEAAKKLGQP